MAFTEKVSLSGAALSFLLYECMQSQNGQEGFLLGEVTSQMTSHISDSQNDNSRLDTEITVRAVLPSPATALIYTSTGRLKEDKVAELLVSAAPEVVGWYKFRRGGSLKPTLRDKIVMRSLQKYFERNHNRQNFVFCNVASKESSSSATHTISYRFGKINCLDVYEYVEDVTPNLGEKSSGYRKSQRRSMHGVFNSIVREATAKDSSSDAVLRIQKAVDAHLLKEAQKAVTTEITIRELKTEINQMTAILAERHCLDVAAAVEERKKNVLAAREKEMAEICAAALATPAEGGLAQFSQYFNDGTSDSDDVEIVEKRGVRGISPILPVVEKRDFRGISPILPIEKREVRAISPVLPCQSVKNYASALKNTSKPESSVSSSKTEDLIDLDGDYDSRAKFVSVNDRGKRNCSPDY